MTTITFRINGNEEKEFKAKLRESGLDQSKFIRKCISGTKIESLHNWNRERHIYQALHRLNHEVQELKNKYPKIDTENIEWRINCIWSIMSNS